MTVEPFLLSFFPPCMIIPTFHHISRVLHRWLGDHDVECVLVHAWSSGDGGAKLLIASERAWERTPIVRFNHLEGYALCKFSVHDRYALPWRY